MFAFPDGMKLTLTEGGQFPLPLFFTFVFTDAEGKHFYVACLQFYEPVQLEDLVKVYKSVHGEDAVSVCVRVIFIHMGICCFVLQCYRATVTQCIPLI